jgi:hypothetical protein
VTATIAAKGQHIYARTTDPDTRAFSETPFQMANWVPGFYPEQNHQTFTATSEQRASYPVEGTGKPGQQFLVYTRDETPMKSSLLTYEELTRIPDASRIVTVNEHGYWSTTLNIGWPTATRVSIRVTTPNPTPSTYPPEYAYADHTHEHGYIVINLPTP